MPKSLTPVLDPNDTIEAQPTRERRLEDMTQSELIEHLNKTKSGFEGLLNAYRRLEAENKSLRRKFDSVDQLLRDLETFNRAEKHAINKFYVDLQGEE